MHHRLGPEKTPSSLHYFDQRRVDIIDHVELWSTVVPVMNGHPRDQAKVSVHCRWPLIRGNLTLIRVGRGIYKVAVQGRWPLMTGVAQGRYYCTRQVTHLPPVWDHLPLA